MGVHVGRLATELGRPMGGGGGGQPHFGQGSGGSHEKFRESEDKLVYAIKAGLG
ncbi:MAG TPA: hypothetical protein VGB32_10925 [Candidatus Bathyarchaeia archaeon]